MHPRSYVRMVLIFLCHHLDEEMKFELEKVGEGDRASEAHADVEESDYVSKLEYPYWNTEMKESKREELFEAFYGLYRSHSYLPLKVK